MSSFHSCTLALLTVHAQPSDTVRSSASLDSVKSPYTVDIESAIEGGKNPEEDPLMFKSGIKTEDELGELRRRKKGKQLERFHREQNEVRLKSTSSSSSTN